jgi:beta-glucanase (GH16 family)
VVALLGFDAPRAAGQAPGQPIPSPFVPPGYRLEWADEFDRAHSARWWIGHGAPARPGAVPSRDAVVFEDDCLRLSAWTRGTNTVFGWVSTRGSYRRRYGFFEARIRAAPAPGWRAVFWLQSPSHGQYPGRPDLGGAEIQVCSLAFANPPHQWISHSVVWNPYEGTPWLRTNAAGQIRLLSNSPPPDIVGSLTDAELLGWTNAPTQNFHVYALEWTERSYVFYVDGRPVYRTSRGISRVAQFLCLGMMPDLRTGRAEPVPPETASHMWVDYVRVYAPPDEQPKEPSPRLSASQDANRS